MKAGLITLNASGTCKHVVLEILRSMEESGWVYFKADENRWIITNFGYAKLAEWADEPEAKPNNALDFEMALRQLIAEYMPNGLTVTEAVGTLNLCAMDIYYQFAKATE